MSRELKSGSGGNYPPAVKFKVAGTKFVGIIKSYKDGTYGKEFIFGVVSGDAFIGKPDGTKNEKGHNNYAEVDVKPGDDVQLTTTKGGQLETKLSFALIGEKVEIVYNGQKLNPRSGRHFNDFTVKVLDWGE